MGKLLCLLWAISAQCVYLREPQTKADLHHFNITNHQVLTYVYIIQDFSRNYHSVYVPNCCWLSAGLHQVASDLNLGQESSPMSNNIQCHMSRSCSQTQIPVTKSETFSLLGNHQVGTSSTVKSDKRSLASKLSGTLNRTNSGKYRLQDKLTDLFWLDH